MYVSAWFSVCVVVYIYACVYMCVHIISVSCVYVNVIYEFINENSFTMKKPRGFSYLAFHVFLTVSKAINNDPPPYLTLSLKCKRVSIYDTHSVLNSVTHLALRLFFVKFLIFSDI